MKRIEIIETSIGTVQKQNMHLDKEMAELQSSIDAKRSTNQYLLHEKELIARNERYYSSWLPSIRPVRVHLTIFNGFLEWP